MLKIILRNHMQQFTEKTYINTSEGFEINTTDNYNCSVFLY